MKENLVTGKKYRILKDEVANIWDRISFWTKASDVELDDGQTVQAAINQINSDIEHRMVDPKPHASTATTYGVGTTANYGHVRLWTDIYNDPPSGSGYAEAGGGLNSLRKLINGTISSLSDTVDGKAPKNHRFQAGGKIDYGIADSTNYGHVLPFNEYKTVQSSSTGAVASHKALVDCYNDLHGNKASASRLQASVDTGEDETTIKYFTFDWKNGQYGWNEQTDRKGKFHPFNSLESGGTIVAQKLVDSSSVSVTVTKGEIYLVTIAGFETTVAIAGLSVISKGVAPFDLISADVRGYGQMIIGKATDTKLTFPASSNRYATYGCVVIKPGA